jgi:hypothetical protein
MDYSDPRFGPVAGSYNRGRALSSKCGVFLQYLMYLNSEYFYGVRDFFIQTVT